MYRFTPAFQAGVEFNAAAQEISPLANWILVKPSENRPGVTIGTSSDRIFTPPGDQSYYMTVSQNIPGTGLAPYVGLSYSEFERGFLYPAGVNWRINDRNAFLAMYDGHNGHLLYTHKLDEFDLSLMYLRGRNWGVSVSVGF